MRKYLSINGDDLEFTSFFWKDCEPLDNDVSQYRKFTRAHRLASESKSGLWMSNELGVSIGTVRTWLSFAKMPKLAHYLLARLELGAPAEGRRWLTMRCSHGYAIPKGPWVQVPVSIRSWRDFESTREQIEPLDPSLERDFASGFLLGIMIGDASKPKPGNGHRHIDLTLSKEYETNLLIGDLTCQAAGAWGLTMHRIADLAKRVDKPNGFYCWVSESSLLIDWLYNICLGLRDSERTTYDAVQMDWAIDAPDDFRRGLLQGIAESDGSVNIASQAVELWVDPSRDFASKLLESFGVRSFKSREALSITKSQVKKAYEIPLFSPVLRTPRYIMFEKLARAEHVGHGKRLPPKIRSFIQDEGRHGVSIPSISKRVLEEFNLSLSFEAVQRWARRIGFEDPDIKITAEKAMKR